jgi:hypothetical protein
MNFDELQQKLLAAARANPPGDEVPYAFEQRLLARLPETPVPDRWAEWANALWRAAAPCLAVMLLLAAWAFVETRSSPDAATLDVALENAVLAPTENVEEIW